MIYVPTVPTYLINVGTSLHALNPALRLGFRKAFRLFRLFRRVAVVSDLEGFSVRATAFPFCLSLQAPGRVQDGVDLPVEGVVRRPSDPPLARFRPSP